MKILCIDYSDITKHVVLQDVMEHAVNKFLYKRTHTQTHTHTHHKHTTHTYHTHTQTHTHTHHKHTTHTQTHTTDTHTLCLNLSHKYKTPGIRPGKHGSNKAPLYVFETKCPL